MNDSPETQKELTEEEKKKADRLKRAVLCQQEISAALKKYNCRTDVAITINSTGKITGEVQILGNDPVKTN